MNCKNICYTKEFYLNIIASTAVLTGFFLVMYKLLNMAGSMFSGDHCLDIVGIFGVSLFTFFLTYGNIVYSFSRYGYFKRLFKHKPTNKSELNSFLLKETPSLLILVPSYKEEIQVIRQSLLSAALQNYPNRRVVLLIDNPPSCPILNETRNLVNELNNLFKSEYTKYMELEIDFQQRLTHKTISIIDETSYLISIYENIILFFENQALLYEIKGHADKKFIELTFTKRILNLKSILESLKTRKLEIKELKSEYITILGIFNVELSSFERKQYANLSHASNKSMNINSYLGLLGKHLKEGNKDGKIYINECASNESSFYFQNAIYISILDADSILTYDYGSRLIFEMEKSYFQNTAVIQTPYSAYPKAPGLLERIAGAATDVQYNMHQGFTYFGATFWVGANALIRKSALDDILEQRLENGFLICRYIQDRTVIEDTESSIDLAAKGWKLYNYPERLSYSATPPDFGSLIIQRKRWANGGLIILPKALAYFIKSPKKIRILKESLFRVHYLLSMPSILFSTLLMQVSPFTLGDFPLEALLLTIPYLFLYARDLKQCGYKYSDLFRVLSLNMVLLPVNFAGVLQSFKQIIFNKHTVFFRTPKISDSTPIPLVYKISIILLVIYSSYIAIKYTSSIDAILAFLFAYGLIVLLNPKWKLKKILPS
ncbi:MAG: glycosyl transferase [Parachlamydiaceae bacterium]|nr:glycosyl transferase [Parachlamydiaceae bacterium]